MEVAVALSEEEQTLHKGAMVSKPVIDLEWFYFRRVLSADAYRPFPPRVRKQRVPSKRCVP